MYYLFSGYIYRIQQHKKQGEKRERRKEKKGMKEDSNPAPSARRDYTSPLYRIHNTPQRLVPYLWGKVFNFIPFAWNFLKSDKKKQRDTVIQSSNVVMSGKQKSRKAQVEFP